MAIFFFFGITYLHNRQRVALGTNLSNKTQRFQVRGFQALVGRKIIWSIWTKDGRKCAQIGLVANFASFKARARLRRQASVFDFVVSVTRNGADNADDIFFRTCEALEALGIKTCLRIGFVRLRGHATTIAMERTDWILFGNQVGNGERRNAMGRWRCDDIVRANEHGGRSNQRLLRARGGIFYSRSRAFQWNRSQVGSFWVAWQAVGWENNARSR